MQRITVRNNQTLLDLSLQTTGSVEEAFNLALANGLGITDEVATGTLLARTDVVDEMVVEQYTADRIIPATGITVEQLLEGIDYWAINIDFKIS
jgi:hypothetical protein